MVLLFGFFSIFIWQGLNGWEVCIRAHSAQSFSFRKHRLDSMRDLQRGRSLSASINPTRREKLKVSKISVSSPGPLGSQFCRQDSVDSLCRRDDAHSSSSSSISGHNYCTAGYFTTNPRPIAYKFKHFEYTSNYIEQYRYSTLDFHCWMVVPSSFLSSFERKGGGGGSNLANILTSSQKEKNPQEIKTQISLTPKNKGEERHYLLFQNNLIFFINLIFILHCPKLQVKKPVRLKFWLPLCCYVSFTFSSSLLVDKVWQWWNFTIFSRWCILRVLLVQMGV